MRYLIIILSFFFVHGHSHQFEKNSIVIKNPILKINSNSKDVGAGYFKIYNSSQKNVYFKKIKSEISKKQEVHEVIKDNDIFKMRPLTKPLLIRAGEELAFEPQSYHIMFFKLNKIPETSQTIKASLYFNDDLIIPVDFKIITNSNIHKHH